jgi:murein L,D-transpeptidase YcbB/YkuD
MHKVFIKLLFLLSIFQLALVANWTKSLGELQKSDSIKKSYLVGMLTDQSYGIYKVEELKSKQMVLDLYEKNENNLYWFDDAKILTSDITDMVEAIKRSSSEALNPNRYHLQEINFIYKKLSNGMLFDDRDYNLAATKLDILLSDAFLTLIKDLTQGQIDYRVFHEILDSKREDEDINYRWENSLQKYDYLDLLEKTKDSGSLIEAIYALAPKNEIYIKLKDAYFRYKGVKDQGGFQKISKTKNLKVGSVSKVVMQLRIRLNQSGDLDYIDDGNKKLDKELATALKRFQKRVGLWPSGILNSTTRNALNVSIEKRLAKIKLNLERSRWESDDFDYRYIFVNIPEFKMRFMEYDRELLTSRVIVGKRKNPTPIFKAKMSYVVLNPRWSVPNSIVVKEMLEKLQEDPYYLEDRNYKMYNGWNLKKRKEVDAFDVDWFEYDDESRIPFNIVQEPGVKNPLGNVKFMFPNNHAVYMHDTPTKKLFKKSVRAFSHGCIRLYQPQKLLEFISDTYLESPYENVKSKLDTGENQSLTFKERIPVYIRYYTAFVDEYGGVHFSNDIYGYDQIHQKLLKK